MFISTDSRLDRVPVRPWGTKGEQSIVFGPIIIVLQSPEDCDEVIKAAAAAKRQMLAARTVAGDFGPEIVNGGAK